MRTLSIFEEMDMRTDTIISGTVTDDAALRCLVERVGGLGFEIVEVHQLCNRPDEQCPTAENQLDRPTDQGDN